MLQGVFAAARAAAPSVIFIDEIDSLAPARGGPNADGAAGEMTGRLVSTLLLAMEEGQPSWPCAGLGLLELAYLLQCLGSIIPIWQRSLSRLSWFTSLTAPDSTPDKIGA